MNVADELQKLHDLHQSGTISDEEYARAKARVLDDSPSEPVVAATPVGTEEQARQWASFLHFSQLAVFLLPVAGLILPILIWQIKKAEYPSIDEHGKVVLNWILSEVIYLFASAILAVVIVGIPLLVALVALSIIFPIIGGIKASDGQLWRYPLSIRFF